MPIEISGGGSGGGGSGTVTNVSSANTAIAVANPTTTPVLTVATLDVLATDGPPAASVPLNAQKITGLANGSAASDAAAFGQIPTALPPSGAAGGDLTGTYPNPSVSPAANVAMNTHKLTGLAAGSGAGDSLRYEQVIGSNVLAVGNLVAGSAGQVLGGTGPAYAFPPGYELNYTQVTTAVNVTSTTEATGTTLLSPGAITFDGAPVLVHFFCPDVQGPGVAGGNLIVSMFESSTQIGRIGVMVIPSSTGADRMPFSAFYRFTPTAASHTYTITGSVSSTTSTPNCNCGAGGTATPVPMFVRFTKV